MDLDLQYVNQAVQRLGREPASAIPLLQALQDHFGYLPEEGLRRICETTRIKPAALAGVASFYDMFRHKPAGKNIVRVCHGTACHVTGIERVEAALRRELRIPDGQDTDADRQFTIEPVACLGCCTLAPVMKIGHSVLGHATAEKVPALIHDFLGNRQVQTADTGDSEFLPFPPHVNFSPGRDCNSHEEEIPQINIGLGSCCMAKGSDQVFMGLAKAARDYGVRVHVKRVGCVGMCHRTPIVEVVLPGQPNVLYAGVGPAQAQRIFERHF